MNLTMKNQEVKTRKQNSISSKIILLLFGIILFTACKKQEPQRYFSKSPEIDLAKDVLKDYEDANWEKWMAHYADTAKIYQNSIEPTSPKEALKSLQGLLANVSSYKFDDKDMWYEMVISDEGNKWVNFWGNWRGKLKANDKELVIPVNLTIQFVDGKIVEEYQYFNTSEMVAALQEIEAAKMANEEKEE